MAVLWQNLAMTEPLRMLNVITDDVGKPGDLGSGTDRYRVPIRLSRRATEHEADLITKSWNDLAVAASGDGTSPVSVTGDILLLERTTIEELRDAHAATLRQILQDTDRAVADLRARIEQRRITAEQQAQDHRRHVAEVAASITFADGHTD